MSTQIAALRETPGVVRASVVNGWGLVQAETASRAVGIAECLREAGFTVRHRPDTTLLAFR